MNEAGNKTARKYKVTPTPRQRRAAKIIADIATGKRPDIKNSGDIVAAAGYAATNTTQPKRILDTEGVKDALADLGFTPDNAKNVVTFILNNTASKDQDRLRAADMVFRVHGTYAAEKTVSLNVDVETSDERVLELAKLLRDRARDA
jgi:hypothetical protein